ncbi:dienelactone hydrolase-like protein [Viridothelium virens]|uniref:Dienelactone hydrolase-like protein n=1 Tax=Viridothelium virens TaxID=1048519 RepID=A0A6A6GZ49_VIRVR|nr:dienelactone hydrolase-like protein [Viridothelium virens]
MATLQFDKSRFLDFSSVPRAPPKLFVTAETSDFDEITLQKWRDEGFDVEYLPLENDGGQKAYLESLKRLHEGLGVGDYYGIVAYGDAAALCLDAHIKPNNTKICALVAYYPSSIPAPQTHYPPSLKVLVHLPSGEEIGVSRNAEILGLQGKRRTVKKRVDPGLGSGGELNLGYKAYTYDGVEAGFAEHDLDEYEKVAERLAWSRSLGTVRKGFRVEVDLEGVWDRHTDLEFKTKNADKTLATMVAKPYVNHIPTLTGGIGAKALHRFYADFFIPGNPPSFRTCLLSRTIGVDRVVDELLVTFKHTQPVPWMLPGIPATDKQVKIALVSVVCIRGGKLYHEHIYWDQASVLVQVGLLNPELVPEAMKKQGVERLPVVGVEGAEKVVDEESVESNELIPEW